MVFLIHTELLSFFIAGKASVVCIATVYELDGPGINSWWGTGFSAPFQTSIGTHSDSCIIGTGPFSGAKSAGRGEGGTDHPPHLAPRLKKEWRYTSTIPM